MSFSKTWWIPNAWTRWRKPGLPSAVVRECISNSLCDDCKVAVLLRVSFLGFNELLSKLEFNLQHWWNGRWPYPLGTWLMLWDQLSRSHSLLSNVQYGNPFLLKFPVFRSASLSEFTEVCLNDLKIGHSHFPYSHPLLLQIVVLKSLVRADGLNPSLWQRPTFSYCSSEFLTDLYLACALTHQGH